MSEEFENENLDEEQQGDEIDEEMLDIYRCYDHQEALRLLDLLETKNIEGLLRDRSTSAFPTSVGMTSQQIIAVLSSDQQEAVAAIKTAINDEVVSGEGVFLPE
ncbi:MAG: hypothetical protein CMH60_04195 [Myxococcales bacterium]|nr:hypothetical protein [Myxococcales bacterium]|tara:strand:+ start:135 stop:446 length:312 start_codon:yes stop_codon:yes gene_type:complete